ncbi:MAG: 50S ribosomal protein L6 [Elusimicrobia bacterium CG08_land_8_20_14_0_20_51_18]|nr:MAG: 50S ribosomal protein L6 [Elusimicrobia bacterium CG08_land_8_20_14_0_20_51_18]
MSRIGRKIIEIPEKVDVSVQNGLVNVKGPKGELTYKLVNGIDVEIKDKKISVTKKADRNDLGAIFGTTRAKINNMVEGVTRGFAKNLEINGVGFKGAVQGAILTLQVGFSHPVLVDIPKGLEIKMDPKQTLLTISGVDKDLVGNVASKIKKIKPPEPYKGTGIKYQGERIIRKAGKSAAGASSGASGGAEKK